MITLKAHYSDYSSNDLPIKTWKFPGGEVGFRLENESLSKLRRSEGEIDSISFTVKWEGSDDLLLLSNAVDAVRREFVHLTRKPELVLRMPYFPYARQDRVCNEGESHALKVFATQINAMNFGFVTVLDPHSNVLEGVLDRMSAIPQHALVSWVRHHLDVSKTIVVAPDEGAMKKSYLDAKTLGINEVITCFKQRDLMTGNILGIKPNVSEGFKTDKNLIVFDDICDGGRTFQELYPVLRNITHGNIMLHVTHGIFSKGIEPLLDYDKIFTVNLMNAIEHEKLITNKNWS